jgi:hypothetical protein
MVRLMMFQSPTVKGNTGWMLSTFAVASIITANWEASSGNKWAFPLGAGIGKIFRIREQPMNASLQAFDYLQSRLVDRDGPSAPNPR